jgi:hypothetical protein
VISFVLFDDIKFTLRVFGFLDPQNLTAEECLALYFEITGRYVMTARHGLPYTVSEDDIPVLIMSAATKLDI